MTATERHDLLVVGGGASGAATAYWAARHGLDVAVLEPATPPREPPCSDGVPPRAVARLRAMGLGDRLATHHRVEGLRAVARRRTLELAWPRQGVHPDHGYAIRRPELDRLVADNAVAAGAIVHQGTEVVRLERERGHLVGATFKDGGTGATRSIRAPWIVVADRAPERFGRALGAAGDPTAPCGKAVRGYFESPDHDDGWIEVVLDPRDGNGSSIPGYGWIVPLRDGTINVGLALPLGFRDGRQVDPTALWHGFTRALPAHWEIDPGAPLGPPDGGRLPVAASARPEQGPNWLLLVDPGGGVNPIGSEGLARAYDSGRVAAALVAEAHGTGNGLVLERSCHLLDDRARRSARSARLLAEAIGNPRVRRQLARLGMWSRPLMARALETAADLLDGDGPAASDRGDGAVIGS